MKAAFFDLDKTLIARTSSAAFAQSLQRDGVLTRRQTAKLAWIHLKYMRRSGPEESMQLTRLGLEMSRGWEQRRVRQLVESNLQQVIDPLIYPRALELLNEHAADGHLIVVVSSSPEDIVFPIASYVGADVVIASRPVVDDNGRYTGALSYFAYGSNKVRAMQELSVSRCVTLEKSWAYSDSITDLPMLEAVGHPVVVNPDDELRAKASEGGWHIESFTSPGEVRPTASGRSTVAFAPSPD